MTCRFLGIRRWGTATRDDEGHRQYKPVLLVGCDPSDGPANALQTPGLPLFGSQWFVLGDIDIWAWCRWTNSVKAMVDDEKNTYFEIEYLFSTKPPILHSCNSNQVENPLLMPSKVSGGAVKYSEEKSYDRFGKQITNSAFELIRGPQAEFDTNRSNVRIEMNVASLNLDLVLPMVNTVNAVAMWGQPIRCIKMSSFTWDRKYYGTCFVYYTWVFEFDIWVRTDPLTAAITSGFDRDILDEGTKVLRGHWDTDPASGSYGDYLVAKDLGGSTLEPDDPRNFIAFQDFQGNLAKVVLNSGVPAGVGIPGAQTTIVNTTTLVNGALSIIAQPSTPANLIVAVAYGGALITVGFVTVNGLDDTGVAVTDNFNIGSSGDHDYMTSNLYTQVNSISVSGLVGATGASTIGVKTNAAKLDAGNIHVEQYQESDFTLLGIPLSF